MMNHYLNDVKEDLLKEVGNIGMGNAASSLSFMLNERVNIQIPEVSIVSLGELPDNMGGAESVVAGVYVKVRGDVDLYMIFILPLKSALYIVETLTEGASSTMDELGCSAVMEVGNIVTAGYINAFADLTGFTLLPNPPSLAIDLSEAILGTILAEVEIVEDFVLLIKTVFETGQSKVEGYLSMIPDIDSFEVVYKTLLKGV